MRTFALPLVALGVISAAAAVDKKEPPMQDGELKCVLEQFDKAWGIKFKSMVVKDGTSQSQTEIKITLDFTKDVSDVMDMRKAFAASGGIPLKLDDHPIVFHLFDEDNVSIRKYVIMRTEGDLTGVKGDAFRIFLVIDKETLKKAKKLEARLTSPPKTKD